MPGNWKKAYRVCGNKSLRVIKVLQAKLRTQEASNGQFEFSILQRGKPVPSCIYPEVSSEELYEMVNDDVRDMIKTLCSNKKAEIAAGAVCADHVHPCVSIPPKLSISDFVGYLKGESALMIFDKHPEPGSKWDRSSKVDLRFFRQKANGRKG